MKILVCRICGEVYLGEVMPASCPFCGAENKYISLAREWRNENHFDPITDISRKNLEMSLEIELSNTAFYNYLSQNLEDMALAKMFEGLARVELRHANVFRELLGDHEEPVIKEEFTSDPIKALEESLAREARAVKLYDKFSKEATEPRVKEVFEAIRDVEVTHIELDDEVRSRMKFKA